jgi:carbon-monoxide dehydrogenase medium subunit
VTLGSDGSLNAVRVALGCVAPTPLRARQAEEILSGKRFSAELLEQAAVSAAEACSPTSDLRGSEKFKRGIVRVLVRRAAETAHERALKSK